MIPLVAFLLAAPPSAEATLDASSRAHAGLRRFRALATVETSAGGKRTQVKYDLVADGDNVRIRIQEAATKGRGRSDRTFLFNRTQVVAYDAIARERLTRPLPPEAKRLGRLIFTVGPVDDLVRFLLDGSQMADFYGNFRGLGQWKVSSSRGATTLTRSVGEKNSRNQTQLQFAPRSNLLTGLSIKASDSQTRWQIQYVPPIRPSLSVPGDTRSVTSFTVAPEPPKYASRAAEKLAKSMIRAYSSLRRGIVSVRDDSGRTKIVLDGPRIREESAGGVYAYDGRTLSVLDHRRRIHYRGITSRNSIPSIVASANGRVDPLSRQILLGKTPLQELMVPEMTIATGGSVEMDGIVCDILRIDAPRIRVTLCVRRDNSLLDSASTNTLDARGRPVSTTARRFRYMSLTRPQPSSDFVVGPKAGFSVRPLPKVPRR